MNEKEPKWGDKYVTWQAFGILATIIAIGIGWSLVSAQQADARSQKRDDEIRASIQQYTTQQQALNDSVIRLITQEENNQKLLDKIANRVNIQ